MKYVLLIGVLILIAGFTAFVKNWRAARGMSAPPEQWLRLYRWRWFALVTLGAAAYYMTWHITGVDCERLRIAGFPFPAAAFDSRGADYVGPLTLPFMLLDILTWALIPDLCLYAWRGVLLRRSLTIGA